MAKGCQYFYEGEWYTEEALKNVYNRVGDTTAPSKASPSTMKKVREFLDRIGVEVETLSNITFNGKTLGVNGLADPLNKLIQVTQGKEDTVLPEEAMHMAVDLIEQHNPKLFKEMMDRAGRYNLSDQVMSEYQNNPFYQKDGRPDVRKIKKEAIGKILAQTVINKNEGADEKPELLVQTRNWWQKIIDFLKDLFLRAGFNPFETAASQILRGEDLGHSPRVILPLGTSGSGKSTWIRSLGGKYTVISPDEMRKEFTGDINNKTRDTEIYEEVKRRAIDSLRKGKQVIIDSTNLQKERRRDFINAVRSAVPNASIQYKLMPLNPELAKRRIKNDIEAGVNRANVPESTIDRHALLYKEMLRDIEDEQITEFDDSQKGDIFASRNPNAVNATMKLVQSLRDPRAERWFKSLDRDTFLKKLQQDLQAPKNQVDMLKTWLHSNNPESVGDMIAAVLSELSYTLEIIVSTRTGFKDYGEGTYFDYEGKTYEYDKYSNTYFVKEGVGEEADKNKGISITKEEFERVRILSGADRRIVYTDYYKDVNVLGGVNYRENEIRTPDITPSIQGHAQFSTDKGIGWFRSDDKLPAEKKHYSDKLREDYNKGWTLELEELERISLLPTKTRRILEIQSDLFQKGRSKRNIVQNKFEFKVGNDIYSTLVNEENQEVTHFKNGKLITENEFIIVSENLPENQFLQILNKDNNWVTFFVKSIIQDSARKGYERVRFPGGSTANKIEGQQTIEEFIEDRKIRIEAIKRTLDKAEKVIKNPDDGEELVLGYHTYFVQEKIDDEGNHIKNEFNYYVGTPESTDSFKNKEEFEKAIREDMKGIQREMDNFEREIEGAMGPEGLQIFSTIANFYENTLRNILKKHGYIPEEVIDEYENKWFEIAIDSKRDLGDFYFQVSGPQDLGNSIRERNANITKKGDKYEINGNKIRKTVQQEVLDFYRKRLGARKAERALSGYRQETEGKVQLDIIDILKRYIDDDGKLREIPQKQVNPSSVNPDYNTFYQTLESHLSLRLSSYEPGTTFFNNVNVFDGINTVGHIDLLAITPTGIIDILQFKVPQIPQGRLDIPVYRQEAYNTEIEALRKILQKGYNVPRSNFAYTRVIPIRADYDFIPGVPQGVLVGLTVGNVNVELIEDQSLIPIASESEVSGNERFDEFIRRLRGLAQKLASERVSPEKRQERTIKVASITSAIRKLQIQKNADGVLQAAKTLIKSQKETYKELQDRISNTDPQVASIGELNKIANDILDGKDELEVYSDIHQVLKNALPDTADNQDKIKEAREISDDARDIIDQYWDMSVKFRTDKFAARVGIKDEFNPEKKLTWYRRMVRSLSQSSIKAGAELWELVKRINGQAKIRFLDRLDELSDIEKRVKEWLGGRPVEELYKRIFQVDNKGRWNGSVIQRIDREFYEGLRLAQSKRDSKWIKENIDTVAYKDWFIKEHQRRINESKIARVHEDDAENQRLINQDLQNFVDNFHIDFKGGISTYNYKLRDFPKVEKWESAEYKEIKENKALLDLYEYWIKRLEESWREGMIQEHAGWSWFPNVRRGFREKISTAKGKGSAKSLFSGIRIEAEDEIFGKIDPITGKPVDEVHANFVFDLGQWVEDADGNYFLDYSEKSMDIFKVIALWDSEIVKYQLRTESEALARLLYYTESQRKAYESSVTGRLKRDRITGLPVEISNEINATYIKENIDAAYYGKQRASEFDVTINIPWGAAVDKINKLFNTEMITPPVERDLRISGIKAIDALNRFFTVKTLGVNLMTSVAQLFGGTTNVMINQGLYFNKKDLVEAELKYVSGRFWSTEEDKKLAGLLGYFHAYTDDKASIMMRKMSLSKAIRYFSSDHLFVLQRGADDWVNSIIGMSMIRNAMVHDGKIVNIRDFVRKELGHSNKYSGSYDDVKKFNEKLEKRVEELKKSPEALINLAKIDGDFLSIPGIGRDSEEAINFRQSMMEIMKDALGNTSREDLSLYKRSIMWQSFFMFKNWIPRMLDVRGQSLKYNPGTQKYEYGRVRMLYNAVRGGALTKVSNLMKMMGGSSEPIIEVAKKEYQRKKEVFADELQDLDMTEAEFVDMYIKGVRAEVKELILLMGLLGILIAARVNSPDDEDDPEIKGAYRWMLKGLDKLTDEVVFFYNPKSFTDIVNGSVFPSISLLVEIQRFLTVSIQKAWYTLTGDEEAAEKKKVSKYLFRMLPVTKELITYIALFNDDIAKEYGIRISSHYGSIR